MRALRLAFLAGLFGATCAAASPAGDIAGTWECRLPGVEYRNKPPILYIADAGGDQSQVTIEVDGFAREIYGRSEITPDQDGWWKVKPAQGQEFMIRPEGSARGSMFSSQQRFTPKKEQDVPPASARAATASGRDEGKKGETSREKTKESAKQEAVRAALSDEDDDAWGGLPSFLRRK